MQNQRNAFTLIELLIVVAIIAILAAIAVPNFLEAQTRAKVSRTVSDLRTIATALETYRLDNNNYPPSLPFASDEELGKLTTPITYISSVPREIFIAPEQNLLTSPDGVYDFVRHQLDPAPTNLLRVSGNAAVAVESRWALVSVGPNRFQEFDYITNDIPNFSFEDASYDASNGTVSNGDIFRVGP